MLEEANAKDMELYDYVCNEIYRRQIKIIGSDLLKEVLLFKKNNRVGHWQLNLIMNRLKRNIIYKPLLRYSQFVGGRR